MSDSIKTLEKSGFSSDFNSFLDIFGDKDNTGVVFSRQLAEALVNLRGGEVFYKAQNHHLVVDGYNPEEDMSNSDQIEFFRTHEAEIIAVVKAMHQQAFISSFTLYVENGLCDYLGIDEVAAALHECAACNEKPSRDRLKVCGWMIRKCLYQLANAYDYRLENGVDINTDNGRGIIKKGRKVHKIERIIYTVNKESINNIVLENKLGVVIDGHIHWVKGEFLGMSAIDDALKPLGVEVRSNGDWGLSNGTNYPPFNRNINRIKEKLGVFSSESVYVKKALLAADGELWWAITDIKNKYM